MALVAMSCFKPSFSFAQTFNSPKSPGPGSSAPMPEYKIKTPDTKKQLLEDKSVKTDKTEEAPAEEKDESTQSSSQSGAAPRRLQQHGLGFGLGETFLMGNYAKHGSDKITLDLLYSYAASYSFDLLVNAHMSEHKDKSDRMKLLGLTSSIKGRFVEYDNFSPYFLGGLGFYAPQAKRRVGTDQEWSDRKITFGLNFGGGVDLRLNEHYVVGVMGQMHWPFAIEQNAGPDVKGYYFKLLITGMYLF
jgi:opacity protein-like surface antigen